MVEGCTPCSFGGSRRWPITFGSNQGQVPAQAAETPQTGAYVVGAETRQKLSPEDVQFVKNVSKAGPTFVDEEGKIATTASDRKLSDNYGFSDQDLERLFRPRV